MKAALSQAALILGVLSPAAAFVNCGGVAVRGVELAHQAAGVWDDVRGVLEQGVERGCSAEPVTIVRVPQAAYAAAKQAIAPTSEVAQVVYENDAAWAPACAAVVDLTSELWDAPADDVSAAIARRVGASVPVILQGVPAFKQKRDEVADMFEQAKSLAADEGTVTAFKTPGGSVADRYQFFTPGVWMGVLVSALLLSILYGALLWLASLEISYKSFEKQLEVEKKTQ